MPSGQQWQLASWKCTIGDVVRIGRQKIKIVRDLRNALNTCNKHHKNINVLGTGHVIHLCGAQPVQMRSLSKERCWLCEGSDGFSSTFPTHYHDTEDSGTRTSVAGSTRTVRDRSRRAAAPATSTLPPPSSRLMGAICCRNRTHVWMHWWSSPRQFVRDSTVVPKRAMRVAF